MKCKGILFLILFSFNLFITLKFEGSENRYQTHYERTAPAPAPAPAAAKPKDASKKKTKKPEPKKQLVKKKKPSKAPHKPTSPEEAVYLKIRDAIVELAIISMAKSVLKTKIKTVGALSESYPKELRELANKKHYDKEVWKSVMAIPNKLYRFCIYPNYQLNYSSWCEKKYQIESPQKLVNCRNTFCTLCCDNMQIMLRNTADNNPLGDLLDLSQEGGYRKITQAATLQEIHECRKECQKTYPVSFPKPPLPVPRDPKLGKWSEYPGKSCADIKRWGAEDNDSGIYWIDLGKAGKTQVYCDMYTLRGGWTLFFNYLKLPNSEIQLKSDKIPGNLKINSHINLVETTFNEFDVKELRFFCTEKSTEKIFWHFKTDSPRMLSTAFSGDQRKMELEELKNTYGELQFPGKVVMWKKAMDQYQMMDELNKVGNDAAGGFWDRPFGSTTAGKFWTVKGQDKNNPAFECGTKHKTTLESATAYTHHTIWFRGDPPKEDFARQRYYNKEVKKLQLETRRVAELKKLEEARRAEAEKQKLIDKAPK